MSESKEKVWYDTKTGVITLLIIFFPMGLYGLIKNNKFKVKTKWILGTVFLLIFGSVTTGLINLNSNLEKEAKEAGYESYSEYSEAKKLGLENPEAYQEHKERIAALEQQKIEEERQKKEQEQKAKERVAAFKEQEEKQKNEETTKTVITLPNGEEIFETLAVNLCRDEIKGQLLSPSSAKFPSVFSGEYTLPVKDGNTFTYRNYVDAPNSLGVMLRKNFVCVVDGDANTVVAEFD